MCYDTAHDRGSRCRRRGALLEVRRRLARCRRKSWRTNRQSAVQAVRRLSPLQVAARGFEREEDALTVCTEAGARSEGARRALRETGSCSGSGEASSQLRRESQIRGRRAREHPSFGQGVIEVAEPGKITCFFASGRRVLVQSKRAGPRPADSQPPKPLDHSTWPAATPRRDRSPCVSVRGSGCSDPSS